MRPWRELRQSDDRGPLPCQRGKNRLPRSRIWRAMLSEVRSGAGHAELMRQDRVEVAGDAPFV